MTHHYHIDTAISQIAPDAALDDVLATLEGAAHAVAFEGRQSAANTLFDLILSPADHGIVAGDSSILQHCVNHRIPYDIINSHDAVELDISIRPETQVVWIETPAWADNTVADVPAMVDVVCHSQQPIVVCVNNTRITPYLQQPIALGADVVIYNDLNTLTGRNDLDGSALVVESSALFNMLMESDVKRLPPEKSKCAVDGIRTLAVRLKRQSTNAMTIARWLTSQKSVKDVHYPGLISHKQHNVAKTQMRHFGKDIVFTLKSYAYKERDLLRHVKVFAQEDGAVSTRSTISASATGLIRLSIGMEHVDDLIADLENAFMQES